MLGCNQVDFFLTTGVPGWNKIQHMLLAWCCGYKTARTHCTKRLTNPSQGPDAHECTQWPCKLPLHDSHCNMQMHTALYGKPHEGFMAGWLLSIESCYINQTSVSQKLTEKRKIRRMQVPQRQPLYSLGHSTLGWGRVYSQLLLFLGEQKFVYRKFCNKTSLDKLALKSTLLSNNVCPKDC